jgi:hypothetical protein
MSAFRRGAIALLIVGAAALAIAACGSSKKSSSSGGGSSVSGKTLDIYSDLPLLGPLTSATEPLVNGIKLALSQAGNKAGPWSIKYTSLNDATAAKASYDLGQCASDAARSVQLGLQRGRDPDRQPGGDPHDQSRQHVRWPDDQRAGQCPR